MNVSSTRTRCWGLAWPLVMVVSALLAHPAWTQASDVVRIEEDWEMVVGVPSANNDAPQVTCLISPLGNADSFRATFVVNHHDVPNFAAGGLQMNVWNGEELLVSKSHPEQSVLNNSDETICWTQAMEVTAGGLVFEVVGGTSTTWGNFGGNGTLRATVGTPQANLDGYDPAVSVTNSGVSYAANRVRSLVLKRVRVYGADGLIGEDTTRRVVHSMDE